MNELQRLKDAMTQEAPTKTFAKKDMVSTGSTLLNLALSGKPLHGLIKGRYYFFVGDSSSGKTFIVLTALAEASINKNFDEHTFIYDDVEDGALMDKARFFGEGVASRLTTPSGSRCSTTVEEFWYNVDDALSKGPCIYILDSMDALDAKDDLEKFQEKKKSFRKQQGGGKGKEVTGSYGMAKAKANSDGFKRIRAKLQKTGSILIIISQTRDNINAGPFGEKRTRAGGRALKFYATCEIWSSQVGKIKKKVKDKDRQIGIDVKLQVKKNRISGKDWTVQIPIYFSFGIDDLGCCIDFLLEEGHWKANKGVINAKEFDFEGKRDALVSLIEEEEKERELRLIVGRVWSEVEEACQLKRKKRY